MQYKIIRNEKGKVVIYVLYADNTFALLELIADRPMEEIIRDAYILTVNATREIAEGGVPTDLETFSPNLQPKTLIIEDAINLKAKVYDQYGSEMEENISWRISGTDKAKIKNGKVVEEEVGESVVYSIVAVCKTLEAREQRTIIAPILVGEGDTPYDELRATLDEQKVLLDQQEANFNLGIVTLMQMMMEMGTPEGGEELPPMPPMP